MSIGFSSVAAFVVGMLAFVAVAVAFGVMAVRWQRQRDTSAEPQK